MTTKLLCLLLCTWTAPIATAAGQRHILFEGTNSPDGRYALAWGLSDFSDLDASDAEKCTSKLNFDLIVENYIVNLKSGKIVATVGSAHFSVGHIVRNHGSISACWRADSKAVSSRSPVAPLRLAQTPYA